MNTILVRKMNTCVQIIMRVDAIMCTGYYHVQLRPGPCESLLPHRKGPVAVGRWPVFIEVCQCQRHFLALDLPGNNVA